MGKSSLTGGGEEAEVGCHLSKGRRGALITRSSHGTSITAGGNDDQEVVANTDQEVLSLMTCMLGARMPGGVVTSPLN